MKNLLISFSIITFNLTFCYEFQFRYGNNTWQWLAITFHLTSWCGLKGAQCEVLHSASGNEFPRDQQSLTPTWGLVCVRLISEMFIFKFVVIRTQITSNMWSHSLLAGLPPRPDIVSGSCWSLIRQSQWCCCHRVVIVSPVSRPGWSVRWPSCWG